MGEDVAVSTKKMAGILYKTLISCESGGASDLYGDHQSYTRTCKSRSKVTTIFVISYFVKVSLSLPTSVLIYFHYISYSTLIIEKKRTTSHILFRLFIQERATRLEIYVKKRDRVLIGISFLSVRI